MLTDDPVEAARRRALEDQMYGGGMGGQIRGLLDQFQPTQADRDAARKAQLQTFFLSLLGTQKGNEFGALGRGGLLANAAYNQTLDNSQKAAMERMQAAGMAMKLREGAQQFQDQQQERDILKGFYANQGATPQPQQQPMAADGMGPPAMPQQQMPAQQQPAQPMGSPKRAQYEQAMAMADAYAKAGRGDIARKLQEHAVTLLPKLKDTKTLTDASGKRISVNIYDDGTQEVLPFGPDKEKAHFLDTGKTIGAVDPFTGMPVEGGGMYNKQVTPGEQLSADMTGRGQDITARGQNMADARARDRLAYDQGQGAKPQLMTAADGTILAVDPRQGTGREVVGADGKPLSKGSKLTEVQGNATAFGMRMAASNAAINKLEDSGYNTGAASNLLATNRFTNPLATAKAQELQQNKLNFMTASLRKESGAAISQSEFDTEDRKYFPQVGDSESVKKQKRAMRDLAIKAMAVQAGSGAQQFSAPSIDDLVKKYAR